MADRLRRIPPGLGALLFVSTLLTILWACLTPAFQAPDEQRHFEYVESIGARFTLPGDADQPVMSTQLAEGMKGVNSDIVASQLKVKPEWSDGVEREWLAIDARVPRDNGGGPSPASSYPPTAYGWQAIGYAAGSGGTLFDELLGARLMSAMWLPITVLATWLLAGEVFGRRRLLQTLAAALPALLPMVVFISASVSPDGMLYAAWSLALWLGVRCVKRGVPVRDGIAFFALVGIACTIKSASYALLPPAVLVAALGLWARRPWELGRVARYAGAVAVPLLLTFGTWVAVARSVDRPAAQQLAQTTSPVASTNLRELISYTWQYYLPRLPFQDHYRIPPGGYPLLHVWITQAWGAFGWLEIKFAPWIYKLLGFLTAGIGVAAGVALVRARRYVDPRVAGFLALTFVALVAGLHWTDYHELEKGSPGFMQGRYLFPVIGIFGIALAGAVSLVPLARRAAATSAVVAALLVFHLLALGLVIERFYA